MQTQSVPRVGSPRSSSYSPYARSSKSSYRLRLINSIDPADGSPSLNHWTFTKYDSAVMFTRSMDPPVFPSPEDERLEAHLLAFTARPGPTVFLDRRRPPVPNRSDSRLRPMRSSDRRPQIVAATPHRSKHCFMHSFKNSADLHDSALHVYGI